MLLTYFPSTTDARAAHAISVGAGQTSDDVAIRMVTVPAFQVSGVVIDEAGRPIANAIVRLVGDEPNRPPAFMGGPGRQARSNSSGRFSIDGATNGTYTLLAIAPVVVAGSGGTFTSFGGANGGSVSGWMGGGVATETSSNGTTVEYRDDRATRVPITINQANVSGLEVIVRRPPR